MGLEIIRLNDNSEAPLAELRPLELSKISFVTHQVPNPPLSIWMMSLVPGLRVMPWWEYNSAIDEDVHRLNNLWTVSSAQCFFDCLYLSQLKKFMGSNFYMIAPGYLRTDGWDKLTDQARTSFLRGQGCVYRLEGVYNSKLAINWVPFAQPQSIVKDPSFSALWSLFVASRNDDVANSIGFFQLSDVRKLPQVANLLIQPNENRSVDLASLVDWYGLYSSPLNPDHASCSVSYSVDPKQINRFQEFQEKFQVVFNDARQALQQSPVPHTAFRILSRYIAI